MTCLTRVEDLLKHFSINDVMDLNVHEIHLKIKEMQRLQLKRRIRLSLLYFHGTTLSSVHECLTLTYKRRSI